MKRISRILVLVCALGVSPVVSAGPASQLPARPKQGDAPILLRLKEWVRPRISNPKPGVPRGSRSTRGAMDCLIGHDLPPGSGCPGY